MSVNTGCYAMYCSPCAFYDMAEDMELDVIGLCCEYTEYDNLEEFQADYGDEYETIEDIQNSTTVIMIDDDSFIIRQF